MKTETPTAEQYATENMQGTDLDEITSALVGFAKLHVKAALKAASEQGYGLYYEHKLDANPDIITVEPQSIINAYPLEKII